MWQSLLAEIGPWGLAFCLCILAFAREWVLTRASHLRELAEKGERIADWKAAAKAAQEEAAEYRRQVFVLLGGGGGGKD